MLKPKKYWSWVFVLALFVVGIVLSTSSWSTLSPSKFNAFASCLKDRGLIFYGAFWCPHCQNQKAMFGSAAEKLPYVECSAPDGNSQTPICISQGIKSYPTWVFSDGSRQSGEVSLDQLAQKSGCELPK